MKKLLLFLLLTAVSVKAQHMQLVKPTEIKGILNFSQFQLNQKLTNLLKAGSHLELLSEDHLTFRTDFPCQNNYTPDVLIELRIVRSPIRNLSHGQEVEERLILKACEIEIEVFSVKRKGKALKLTAKEKLLIGILPELQDSESYQLLINDRSVGIDYKQSLNTQTMDLVFKNLGNKKEMQVRMIENFKEGLLTQQFLQLILLAGSLSLQSHEVQFLWSVEPKTQVPRQFLFYQNREVIPREFLSLMDTFYNQNIFPLLAAAFNF